MANQTAKTQKSKPAKPEAPISSTTSAATPESKPNALLGRSLSPVTADTRRAMIAEAAYYIAEQRGFGSDCEVEDWLLAEKQVEAALSA